MLEMDNEGPNKKLILCENIVLGWPKVHSGFPVPSYEKTQADFLADLTWYTFLHETLKFCALLLA